MLSEPFTLGIAVGMPLILIGSVLATSRSPAPAGAAAGTSEAGPRPEPAAAAPGVADPYAPGTTARGDPVPRRLHLVEGEEVDAAEAEAPSAAWSATASASGVGS